MTPDDDLTAHLTPTELATYQRLRGGGASTANGHRRESRELESLRSALVAGEGITTLPAPEWVIPDVLQRDTLAEVFGPSGSGKSYLALSMALSISTGLPWFGREVRQGPVLYIVGEGLAGFGPRVAAWKSYHRIDQLGPIFWLTQPVDLLNPRWVAALVAIATELSPELIVNDTLARSMPGGNENGPEHMTRVVESLDQVRRATGACTKTVHHTGKDETVGSRGHSSFKAAMDTELKLQGAGGRITLYAEKQRNARDGYPIERLRLVEFAGSCVLEEYHEDLDTDNAPLTANDELALRALAEIEVPGGISFTEWKKTAISAGVADGSFARCRHRLLRRGRITNIGTEKTPRYVTGVGVSVGITEVS